MAILEEFKKFAIRGNVVDLAVGVVIGTAFGNIVSSLVSDIIMPPIGLLTGDTAFTSKAVVLREASGSAEAIILNYGSFFNTIIDFLIIAFVIFMVVRQMNKLKKPSIVEPTTKTCPHCATEIPIAAKRCPHCTSGL